jgi:hypothetical protein
MVSLETFFPQGVAAAVPPEALEWAREISAAWQAAGLPSDRDPPPGAGDTNAGQGDAPPVEAGQPAPPEA